MRIASIAVILAATLGCTRKTCPYGMERVKGECVSSGAACADGFHRDEDGDCVRDGSEEKPDEDTGDGRSDDTGDGSDVHGTQVDPESLVDRAWVMDLADGTWSNDSGDVVLTLFELRTFELGVVGANGNYLEVIQGWGYDASAFPGQDECAGTRVHEDVDFSANPMASYGPVNLPITIYGIQTTLRGTWASFTVSADGKHLTDGTLYGAVDIRPLPPLFSVASADDLCDFLPSFGLACTDCPGPVGEYCVEIEITDLEGREMADPMVDYGIGFCESALSCNTGRGPLQVLPMLGLVALASRRRRRA